MDAYDREVDDLDRQLADGTITAEEHREAMIEVEFDYRAAAEESSQRAYEDEMRRW